MVLCYRVSFLLCVLKSGLFYILILPNTVILILV